METDTFSGYKVQRCLFCAARIDRVKRREIGDSVLPEKTFLEGISIMSKFLSVPNVLKFSEKSTWDSFKGEDFVSVLCCKNCYSLLENLVTLKQLIASTEASLQETAQRLKETLVQSEEVVKKNELEYSSNTCVEFRDELFRSIKATRTRRATSALSLLGRNKSSKTKPGPGDPHSVQDSVLESNLRPVYVKLERISQHAFITGRTKQDSDEDDRSNFDTVSKTLSDGNIANDGEAGYQQGKIGRKRHVSEHEQRHEKGGEFQPKVRKERRRTEAKNGGEIGGSIQGIIEDQQDSKTDVEQIPDRYVGLAQPSRTEQLLALSACDLKKKARRPHKNENLRAIEVGTRNKPVFIVDPILGFFTYFYVKFQKNNHSLRCLHPGCEFSEPLSIFGAEQVAFRNFRFHVIQAHRSRCKSVDDETRAVSWWCSICDTQHPNRDTLFEHRRTNHRDPPTLLALCEVCGDSVVPQDHVNHMLTHKNPEEKQVTMASKGNRRGRIKDVNIPLSYPCNDCSKVFKCYTEFRLHKETHVPLETRRIWVCELCGEKFASHNSLEFHKRRIHLKDIPKSLVCPICTRAFMTYDKTKFNDHVRTHTGDKPFQCPTCGKGFPKKDYLAQHEKLHVEAQVACELCSCVYKNIRYLKRHQLKHHPCIVQKTSSAEIIRTHQNLKKDSLIGPQIAFPCEPCGHQYRYKSMLVAHLKGKHSMKLSSNEDYPPMWTYQDHYGEEDAASYDPQLRGNQPLPCSH